MDTQDPRQALGSKLRSARELLGVSQGDAAARSGLTQRDVSQLEQGIKKFVPTPYIQYLYGSGIDLNSLFAEGQQVRRRRGEDAVPDKPRMRSAQEVMRELDQLRESVAELLKGKGK